jgi:uncharacterized protein (TIGR03000 family)
MIRRLVWVGIPALTTAALLALPSFGQAQQTGGPAKLSSGASGNQPAYVRLQVPPNSEVWFDEQKTTQTGSDRLYVSPPLASDKNYVYEVKVRWLENGQPVTRTRKVHVQPGAEATMAFGDSALRPGRTASVYYDSTPYYDTYTPRTPPRPSVDWSFTGPVPSNSNAGIPGRP